MDTLLLPPCRLASRRSSRLFAERFAARAAALAVALLAAPFSAYVHAAAISAGASGDWSSTGTWTGGVVPTSADTVTIGNTYTVTVPSGSQTATSVLVQSGGNLTISGGALTTNGTSLAINNQSGGSILLSSGTLNVNHTVANAEIVRGGDFSMSGGEFNISTTSANHFIVRGNFTISGGNMSWGAGSAARFYGVATTVINVVGDSSTIYIQLPFANSETRRINYNYEFGTSGVSQITTGGSSNTNYSNITVDGTNYTGGAGNHTLMTGVGTGVANGTLTASNFTGYNATINQNGTTYRVTLTSYSTVWDGGGGDTNINTAANWADDLTPNLTNGHNTFTFGTGGSTATINTNLNAAGLVLNRTSSFEIASGAGSLTVGSGGITSSGAAHTISEGVILGADQTWDVTDSLAVSGAVSGAYNLTKAGTGTLTLSNTNTYNGSTTINAGTLEIGGAGKLGSGSYAGNIANAGTFTYNSTSAQTLSGVISGSGALTKNGSGTLTLTGTNDYSGGTTLNAGTLVIGNTAAAGSGSIVQTSNSSLLKVDVTGTINNAISIYTLQASQSATLSGAVTVNNATFEVDSGDTLTISNTINGTGGVTKNGDGTLILSGSNTYSGATTVNAGTLNAASANALGSNNTVQVNGGTLLVSADDAINGMNITLNGTSTTVATLSFTGNYSGTINSLTLNEDSIIDLGGVDLLALEIAIIEMSTHTLSFKNWTGTTLWGGGNGSDTDRIYFGGGNYTLANVHFYSGTTSDSFLGTGFDLGLQTDGFDPGIGGHHIIPVPEPETWATGILLVLGGSVWLWRKRRNFTTESDMVGRPRRSKKW